MSSDLAEIQAALGWVFLAEGPILGRSGHASRGHARRAWYEATAAVLTLPLSHEHVDRVSAAVRCFYVR